MTTQATTPPDTERQGAVAPPSPSIEEALSNYRIVRQIHEDPSCVVYKAEERGSRKAVIVRVGYREVFGLANSLVHSTDRAERLMSIRHPGLAPLLKVHATPDGHWIFVSEAMRGVPLLEHANGLGLSQRNRLGLFIGVCKAIHGLHEHCFVHRDLRPSKILVDGKSHPKITDFGVATLTEFDSRFPADVAKSQGLSHLWSYRSPEQERSEAGKVDIRTDIYALGVILVELLSGDLPDKSADGGEVGFAIRGELGAIVRKAMAPDPDDRYASALTMAEDIDNYLHVRPVQAYSGGNLYGFTKLLSRRRIFIGTAVLAVALLFALGMAKHGLAMRDAENLRNEQAANLTIELSRLQAAVGEAQAGTGRSREALSAAQAARTELESEVTGLRRELGAVADARDTLAAKIKQLEARPDPSSDFAALLIDVVAGDDGPLPQDSEGITAHFLHRAAQVGEARLAGRPELKMALFEGLVGAYRKLGRLGEAAQLLKDVVAFKRTSLGPVNRETVDAANELAMLLYSDEQFEEAELLCRGLLDSSRNAFGDDHERTATAVNNLALTLKAQGKFDAAAPLFRQALETRVRQLGRDDLKTASVMYELGTALFEMGKITESEALFLESLAVFEKELPATHWKLALAEKRFASALMAMGRFGEAEERLLSSHRRCESAFGAEHVHTQEVAAQLAKLYTAWGKDGKAAQWKARSSASDAQAKPDNASKRRH